MAPVGLTDEQQRRLKGIETETDHRRLEQLKPAYQEEIRGAIEESHAKAASDAVASLQSELDQKKAALAELDRDIDRVSAEQLSTALDADAELNALEEKIAALETQMQTMNGLIPKHEAAKVELVDALNAAMAEARELARCQSPLQVARRLVSHIVCLGRFVHALTGDVRFTTVEEAVCRQGPIRAYEIAIDALAKRCADYAKLPIPAPV
jgi:DNA repair exonuclease SbcCD ATPase subunit